MTKNVSLNIRQDVNSIMDGKMKRLCLVNTLSHWHETCPYCRLTRYCVRPALPILCNYLFMFLFWCERALTKLLKSISQWPHYNVSLGLELLATASITVKQSVASFLRLEACIWFIISGVTYIHTYILLYIQNFFK